MTGKRNKIDVIRHGKVVPFLRSLSLSDYIPPLLQNTSVVKLKWFAPGKAKVRSFNFYNQTDESWPYNEI